MDVAEEKDPLEDSNILMYLIAYQGKYYQADCVERLPDTCIFLVDAEYVRKGIFPKNRWDMRFLEESNMRLCIVYKTPLLQQ